MSKSDDVIYEDVLPTEPNLFSGSVPIEKALNLLRLRLLDLTGRNRLINFKNATGKTLQFVHSNLDGVFKRMVIDGGKSVKIAFVAEPASHQWELKNGRLARPDAKSHAAELGINTSYDLSAIGGRDLTTAGGSMSSTQIRALYYADELGKHGRKLEREARLAIEETGANMLYLVFGFLEFRESPGSDKLYQAPLLCVPVAITSTASGQYTTFDLNYTGEELTDNLCLREKVKKDFSLNLPEYDDEGDEDTSSYLVRVEKTVANLPGWKVCRRMTLALLSFANMLMVKDIDPETWKVDKKESLLLEHPLIRQVFEGKQSSTGEASYATEYDIDAHPGGNLPLIYDADSSQHSALIDVMDGMNRVIEGPPGTGKSQTITNIIAAGLQAGKTVLFVSEKLAALEVVKSRLEQAGLEQFVLELHSNKTNKKRVLEALEMRIKLSTPKAGELPQLLEQLAEKRDELRTYVHLLNSTEGNQLDLTLHQVMWRAELNRQRCGHQADIVAKVEYPVAIELSPTKFMALCDRLKYLSEQYDVIGNFNAEHPFWGFFPTELTPEDTIPLQRILLNNAELLGGFNSAIERVIHLLSDPSLPIGPEAASKLINTLSDLTPADPAEVDFSLLAALFTKEDPFGKEGLRILNDISEQQKLIDTLEAERNTSLLSSQAVSAHELAQGTEMLKALQAYGLTGVCRAELENLKMSLSLAANTASIALRDLESSAALFRVPFQGVPADIACLSAMLEQIRSAPLDLLHLRHEGLRDLGAVGAMRGLEVRLQKILADERDFATKLYLDSVPNDASLAEAIQILREGDKWYRGLQAPWRKAVALHRKLTRDKAKLPAQRRLSELEALRAHQSSRRDWNEDGNLKRFSGVNFAGEQTPLNDLIAVADWTATATKSLADQQVSLEIFDPVSLDRSRLALLKAQGDVVEQLQHSLQNFTKLLADILLGGQAKTVHVRSTPWLGQLLQAKKIDVVLSTAVKLMEEHVKPHQSAARGFGAMSASHKVPECIEAITHHAAGKNLLGARFNGRDTMLETAFAAHTYGTLLKGAKLPPSIEQILLSENCADNFAKLESCVVAINKGWQDLMYFEKEISEFGRFDAALWAGGAQGNLAQYISGIAARTQAAVAELPCLLPWAQYVQAREGAMDSGLDGFICVLEAGQLPPPKLKDAFAFRFYASIAQQAFQNHKVLRVFSGIRHTSVREDFARIDREIIKLRGNQVARDCILASQVPGGANGAKVSDKTELRLLEHLIPQQRPRVPLRKMLLSAGRAIQALKPCFMMGPQAVAQFLAPGYLKFDIVIMDEASQLTPEQALGAIARGTQLVVVGDPKQLPPTSFFSRMSAADSDGDGPEQLAAIDAESILDVCISHFQPVRTLRWHYRSQHESLIAFSNEAFYRGNLVVFPSPFGKSKSLGLRYYYVSDGVYENQMNNTEALRVVDAVVDHILHRAENSLGVVTHNVKQRDLISEMLEHRLKNVAGAVEFKDKWAAIGMGLFVKNLENVQGDERDCIMISTTFGKAPGTNVVHQNFGPISRQGGWRRLNVLFTRARKSVVVYSSMRPEDIVADKATPEGTQALRNYLEFARDGVLPKKKETDLPPDSDFEVAVLDVLRSKGYEVVPQLGVAGFRIDIAVKHPDYRSGYLAAIECDGATYHSGVSVRDRDRIRQEILESMGWRDRIWRIWSTDWFRNPQAEAERMFRFLEKLRSVPLPTDYVHDLEESQSEEESAELSADVVATRVKEQAPEELVLEFDQDEFEVQVQVGDLVTYAEAYIPDVSFTVRITTHQTDIALGMVAQSTPLGRALMGATVSEIVTLLIPLKLPLLLLIISIKR